MTSAQVLPNQALSSRKQEHLEAGKRRLEEFRKKKAEGRGKKAASTGQLQSTDVTQFEKLSQEIENTRFLDSSGVTYERDGISGTVSSGTAVTYGSTSVNSSQSTERGFSNGTHAASPILSDNYDAFYDNSVHKPASDPESRWFDGSRFPGPAYTYYDRWREEKNNELSNYPETERELANGITTDRPVALDSVHKIRNINGDIHQSNFYPKSDVQSEENRISSMEHSVEDQGMSNVSVTSILPDQSGSALVQSTVDLARTSATHNESALYNDSTHPSTSVRKFAYVGGKNRDFDHAMILDEGKKKLSGSIYHHPDLELAPESFSTDSRMNFKSFFNQSPVHSTVSETGSRSRLSFLESLNVPRVSSVSHFPYAEPSKSETFMAFKSSKVHSEDFLSSSASQEPFTDSDSMGPFSKLRTSDFTGTYEPSASVNNDGELLRWRVKDDSIQQKNEFPSLKKDDDFAALEQHIEDLTQEKFSLQRALEASRTLAESLAAENSSLTDSFNQQAKEDEAVKHALAVRAAVTSGNYILFFRLYKTAPNLNTCLMDLYVEKMRFEAVKCMSRSYRPTVPVAFIAQILGFTSVLLPEGSNEKDVDGLEECEEWLRAHGATLTADNNGEMQLDAKVSSSTLYMPEPEDAVSHGDSSLAVNDFLTRTA